MNVHVIPAAGPSPVLPSDSHLLNALDKLDGALALLEVSVLATRAINEDAVAHLEEPLQRVILDLCEIRGNIHSARGVVQ